jgi:DUF3054 family protein
VRRLLVAVAADVAAVLLFVVLGRGSHDEGNGLASVLGVAAPFLIGLTAGWLASTTARRRPFAIATGAQVWLATVVVGVLLRWFAWDRGTALSFIVVAALFLGFFVVGWRVVLVAASRPRSAVRSCRPPLEAER